MQKQVGMALAIVMIGQLVSKSQTRREARVDVEESLTCMEVNK